MFKKLKIRQSNYKRKKKFKKRFINLGFSKINFFFKKFFIKLYSIFYKLNTSLKNNFQLLSNPNLFFLKNTVPGPKYLNDNYMIGSFLKNTIPEIKDIVVGSNLVTISNTINNKQYKSSTEIKRYIYKCNYIINISKIPLCKKINIRNIFKVYLYTYINILYYINIL
jgi:hypothetical protein